MASTGGLGFNNRNFEGLFPGKEVQKTNLGPQWPGLRHISDYTGVRVSRAARIEPITPVGQVYASQQFAALASTQRVKDFICDYVGRVPLPKKAGIIPLYLVRRQNLRVGKRIISS